MSKSFEIVTIMRMGDANVYYHLKPLSMCWKVSCIHLIRPLPYNPRGEIRNLNYYEIRGGNRLIKFLRIYRQAVRLGKRSEVRAFVSIFGFPYGFLALLSGLRVGKPVHIGFVGDDWYRYCSLWYGRLLDFFFHKADLITVTGSQMQKEMEGRNYLPEKIFHLPHAIDVDEYNDSSPGERKYDCIFVGDLIRRKRVDIIILAIVIARKNQNISLCIVGDGPLRVELENLVKKNGMEEYIKFFGYQRKPAKFFSDARIVLIASEMEGFPFSLVEGMVAGAVPVSTNVGTISDFIDHEKTGLLVPSGDPDALAESILRLLNDEKLYKRIRANVLKKRSEFRFEKVAGLWSQWLEMMTR